MMNIDKISVRNFRNIGEEQTFFLNSQFTVFIGINGKGKSTILHALRVASGAYFLAIPDVASRHIQRNEIRIVETGKLLLEQYPVKVEATGRFPGVNGSVIWKRQWLEGKSSNTSNNADVGNIKSIASEKYFKITKEGNDRVDLPIVAFFGVSRAFGPGRITSKSRVQRLGRMIFKEGYQDWQEMKAVKFHYEEWLGTYETLVSLEKEYGRTRDAFYSALKLANPYIIQVDFINGELWVKINIEGNVTDLLPLSLHSDGIHYFTAMIAEIAYRCVVLNGYKNENAISETKGIVMIDEIDLHLHPNWQRHVIKDLKQAFPNVQFIATTHSPFIVQSLKSDEVWNLDKIMDVSPNDLKLDTIATRVMGVSSSFSQENEELYEKSKRFINDLEAGRSEQELQNNLEEISDPGVRAFLELTKMSKGK
jgi:predicted ATP-binding protein involved in virulence